MTQWDHSVVIVTCPKGVIKNHMVLRHNSSLRFQIMQVRFEPETVYEINCRVYLMPVQYCHGILKFPRSGFTEFQNSHRIVLRALNMVIISSHTNEHVLQRDLTTLANPASLLKCAWQVKVSLCKLHHVHLRCTLSIRRCPKPTTATWAEHLACGTTAVKLVWECTPWFKGWARYSAAWTQGGHDSHCALRSLCVPIGVSYGVISRQKW